MFVIKSFLDYYQYSFLDFFSSNQLNCEISLHLNILASTTISGFILSFFTGFIYYCYYLTSAAQAIPGMKLHGLRLVDGHGKPVSSGQILLREIISIISFWGFFIGYLMILVTKRHQALHDMATSTYVQDISKPSNAEILISQQYQNYTYGGFWSRLRAMIIDNVLCLGFIFLCKTIAFKGHDYDSENVFINLFFIAHNDAYSIIINIFFYIVMTFYYFIVT